MKRPLIAALAGVALVIAGCGSDDTASSGGRIVKVEMRDNAFAPASLTVKSGEKVRFEFTNKGDVKHEAILGTTKEQATHEKDMRTGKYSEHMGGHGDRADNVTVDPGKIKAVTHTFEPGEELLIGCHESDHYTDGMKLDITVG